MQIITHYKNSKMNLKGQTNPEMLDLIEAYLAKLISHKDHTQHGHEFRYTWGKKFVKFINTDAQGDSVHCFCDPLTGDLYKAAGWDAPARGARGSVFSENPPLTLGDFYKHKNH